MTIPNQAIQLPTDTKKRIQEMFKNKPESICIMLFENSDNIKKE